MAWSDIFWNLSKREITDYFILFFWQLLLLETRCWAWQQSITMFDSCLTLCSAHRWVQCNATTVCCILVQCTYWTGMQKLRDIPVRAPHFPGSVWRIGAAQVSHKCPTGRNTHVVAFKGTEQKKTLADWVQHNQHNTVLSCSFYAQQSLTFFNAPHTICKEILKESSAICHSPIVFHYHHFSMSRDEKLTNVLPESHRANQSSDVKGLWMCSGSLSCCKQSAAQMWETLRDC